MKTCRAAPVRKLIPLAQTGRADEKCSSEAHVTCSAYRACGAEERGAVCPFLHEALMQYCGAAPVTKFVPYTESLLSRCGKDSFRYCELYLSMAHPEARGEDIDGVRMPGGLLYSANHMWLDLTEDGACHAGIDAFLSRALGRVERISYVSLRGYRRPAAVFTVAGNDFEVVFPNPMLLEECNLYLRADPSRVTAEPYTSGWLFEGRPDAETARNLLQRTEAQRWMAGELRRMNNFLQQAEDVAADGGVFAPGIARHLDLETRLALFHEFFSFYENREMRL